MCRVRDRVCVWRESDGSVTLASIITDKVTRCHVVHDARCGVRSGCKGQGARAVARAAPVEAGRPRGGGGHAGGTRTPDKKRPFFLDVTRGRESDGPGVAESLGHLPNGKGGLSLLAPTPPAPTPHDSHGSRMDQMTPCVPPRLYRSDCSRYYLLKRWLPRKRPL